jgi:hypothetical protein
MTTYLLNSLELCNLCLCSNTKLIARDGDTHPAFCVCSVQTKIRRENNFISLRVKRPR